VASAISYLLNPLILPPISFGLVGAHVGAPAGEVAWTIGVSTVFFMLVPLAYVASMVLRGEAESLEVRVRGKRTRPFLMGIVSYLVGMAVLALSVEASTGLIVAIAALLPLNTAVMLLINLRWKISIHVTALASFCSVLAFVAACVAPEAWPLAPADRNGLVELRHVAALLPLIPVLMWARVRVGSHTTGQVMAGALYGLVLPFSELWIVGLLA